MANLTAERLRELLHYDPDTGVFTWKKNMKGGVRAGDVAGTEALTGYLVIRIDGKLYLAHRLALMYVRGAWPANKVDHRNRVRRDNRIGNLRDASDTLNAQNTTARTEYPGTFMLGGGRRNLRRPWSARIMSDRKVHNLGYFETRQEAHQAYVAAKQRLHEGCSP